MAILRDTGAPVIHPSFAWQRPEDDLIHSGNKENPVGLLEFDIYDEQSWVDRDTTAVFLDGIPLDYEWAGDRSLLRVSVPEKWMNSNGSFLSIQVKDLAGNPAEPFFQAIYPH